MPDLDPAYSYLFCRSALRFLRDALFSALLFFFQYHPV